MAELFTPYQPDLEKIARESEKHEPKMLVQTDFERLCQELKWTPGARLTGKNILQALEHGLIRIWDAEHNGFDPVKQTSSVSIDFKLGSEFWHYQDGSLMGLIYGDHEDQIRKSEMLKYTYRCPNKGFVFHTTGTTLALTQEAIAISNVLIGNFDGKSKLARLGISNHQTAGTFEPGFTGQAMMEISNTNRVPIEIAVQKYVASFGFQLLNEACTNPRNLIQEKAWTFNQSSPFGTREPEWDVIRKEAIKLCIASGKADHAHKLSN